MMRGELTLPSTNKRSQVRLIRLFPASSGPSAASSEVAIRKRSGSASLWMVRSGHQVLARSEPVVYGRSYLSHSARTRVAISA